MDPSNQNTPKRQSKSRDFLKPSPSGFMGSYIIWVVVKIMVPFWVPIIIRHLIFRVPKKKDHNSDNHPYKLQASIAIVLTGTRLNYP